MVKQKQHGSRFDSEAADYQVWKVNVWFDIDSRKVG